MTHDDGAAGRKRPRCSREIDRLLGLGQALLLVLLDELGRRVDVFRRAAQVLKGKLSTW